MLALDSMHLSRAYPYIFGLSHSSFLLISLGSTPSTPCCTSPWFLHRPGPFSPVSHPRSKGNHLGSIRLPPPVQREPARVCTDPGRLRGPIPGEETPQLGSHPPRRFERRLSSKAMAHVEGERGEAARHAHVDVARARAADASFAAVARARRARTDVWRAKALEYAEQLRCREEKYKRVAHEVAKAMQKEADESVRRKRTEEVERRHAKDEAVRAYRHAWEAGQLKIAALEEELRQRRDQEEEIVRLKQQVEELNEEVRCCHLEMQENRTSMAMWMDKMMEDGTQLPHLDDASWEEQPAQTARLEEDIVQLKAELEWWKNYGMLLASNLQAGEWTNEEADVDSLVEFVESEPVPCDVIDECAVRDRLERAEAGWRCATSGSMALAQKLAEKDRLVGLLQHEIDTYYSTDPSPVSSCGLVEELRTPIHETNGSYEVADDGNTPSKDVVDRLDEVLASSRKMRKEMEAASAPSTPETTSSSGRSTAGFLRRASLSRPDLVSRASPLSVEKLRKSVQDVLEPRLGAEAAHAHSATVQAVSPGVFSIDGRRTTCVSLPRTIMVRVGGGWSTLSEALHHTSKPTPSSDEEGSAHTTSKV